MIDVAALERRFGPLQRGGSIGPIALFSCAGTDGRTLEVRTPVAVELDEWFARELALLEALRHDHIVRVLDSGRAGDVPWYAVAPAPDVFERLDGGVMGADEVRRLLRHVAAALDHCHGRGVVHVTLTPLDIRLGDVGWLLDGFSVAAGRDPRPEGLAVGNPTYFSPELCRGEQLDGRSDLYALGAVAWLCLTGAPPHQGASVIDMIMQKIQARPRLPAAAKAAPGLAALIERLIEPDREARPASAAAVLDLLAHT